MTTIMTSEASASVRMVFWRRLLQNPNALAGFATLFLLAVLAVLAPVLAPGDPLRQIGTPLQWPLQGGAFCWAPIHLVVQWVQECCTGHVSRS